MKIYEGFFKRAIDVSASAGVLFILAIPFAAVTIWLHFANKGAGAVFYNRLGKDKKICKIFKFKTSTDGMDANGFFLNSTRISAGTD